MSLKTKLMTSLMTVGLVSALVGGATFAIFTDSATNANNTFTAGTVEINSAVTTAWDGSIGNIAPGDTVTQTITVTNNGSLELRYDVAQLVSGDLFAVQGDAPGNTPATASLLNDGVAFTPGDNNFVLAPGASDVITVTVNLPLSAGNQYQADSGNVGLTFNAEQTKNNDLN